MKKLHYLMVAAMLLLTLSTSSIQAQQTNTDTVKVFTTVEKTASFPGGAEGWRRYLEANLRYPKKAQKKTIQGLVKVALTVDSKGSISNVKALNDPGGGLAAEAERVIRESPRWIPAEQNSKKVTYRFVQSITFQLE